MGGGLFEGSIGQLRGNRKRRQGQRAKGTSASPSAATKTGQGDRDTVPAGLFVCVTIQSPSAPSAGVHSRQGIQGLVESGTNNFYGGDRGALWCVNGFGLGTGDGGDGELWRGDGALRGLKHCELSLPAALAVSRSAQRQGIPTSSVPHPADG